MTFIHHCQRCQKMRADKTCGRCRVVRYCGAECQKAAWPEHKRHCSAADAGSAPRTDRLTEVLLPANHFMGVLCGLNQEMYRYGHELILRGDASDEEAKSIELVVRGKVPGLPGGALRCTIGSTEEQCVAVLHPVINDDLRMLARAIPQFRVERLFLNTAWPVVEEWWLAAQVLPNHSAGATPDGTPPPIAAYDICPHCLHQRCLCERMNAEQMANALKHPLQTTKLLDGTKPPPPILDLYLAELAVRTVLGLPRTTRLGWYAPPDTHPSLLRGCFVGLEAGAKSSASDAAGDGNASEVKDDLPTTVILQPRESSDAPVARLIPMPLAHRDSRIELNVPNTLAACLTELVAGRERILLYHHRQHGLLLGYSCLVSLGRQKAERTKGDIER